LPPRRAGKDIAGVVEGEDSDDGAANAFFFGVGAVAAFRFFVGRPLLDDGCCAGPVWLSEADLPGTLKM